MYDRFPLRNDLPFPCAISLAQLLNAAKAGSVVRALYLTMTIDTLPRVAPARGPPTASTRRLHSSSTDAFLPAVDAAPSSSRRSQQQQHGYASRGSLTASSSQPNLVQRPDASPTRAPRHLWPPLNPPPHIVTALREGRVLETHELERLKADLRRARELAAVDSHFAQLFLNAQGGYGTRAMQQPKRKRPKPATRVQADDEEHALQPEVPPPAAHPSAAKSSITGVRMTSKAMASGARASSRPPLVPSSRIVEALLAGRILEGDELERLKADYAAAKQLAEVDPTFARLFDRAQGDQGYISAVVSTKRTTRAAPDAGREVRVRVRDEAVLSWYLVYRERFGLAALEENLGGVRASASSSALLQAGNGYAAAHARSLRPRELEPLRPHLPISASAGALLPAPSRVRATVGAKEAGEVERATAAAAHAALGGTTAAMQAAQAAQGSTAAAAAARAAAQEAREAMEEARRRMSWQPLETVPSSVLVTARDGRGVVR